LFRWFFRSRERHRTAVAGPGRLSLRHGRRAAPDRRDEAAAQSPAGPDRLRQDDGGRRDGNARRLRAAPRPGPDAAAERRLRGRGRVRQPPGPAPRVSADVRAAVVPRPPGRSAGRRGLAAVAGRRFSRPRGIQRPADVHQNYGHGRLIGRCALTRLRFSASHRTADKICKHSDHRRTCNIEVEMHHKNHIPPVVYRGNRISCVCLMYMLLYYRGMRDKNYFRLVTFRFL